MGAAHPPALPQEASRGLGRGGGPQGRGGATPAQTAGIITNALPASVAFWNLLQDLKARRDKPTA